MQYSTHILDYISLGYFLIAIGPFIAIDCMAHWHNNSGYWHVSINLTLDSSVYTPQIVYSYL